MLNDIINDDCLNILPTIAKGSVDLILIDPPYIISRDSFFKKGENSNEKFNKIDLDFGDWDKIDLDWDLLFSEYKRILRPGGTLIIFYDIWKCGILKEIANKYGFKQPRVCMWSKNNPVPINSKSNYLSNGVEFFFSFVNFTHRKDNKPTFNSTYDKGIYNYPLCHGKERLDHPTQKPLGLIKDIILKHTNEGDLVLDSFSGTSTTGVGCIETKRNYILIEKSEKYFKISSERLNKYR